MTQTATQTSPTPCSSRRLAWRGTPEDAIARWPVETPLAALVSADDAPASRWSILATPTTEIRRPVEQLDAADPLAPLRQALESTRGCPPSALPFTGGWVASLPYELGGLLEPRAARSASAPETESAEPPSLVIQRLPGAYVHDRTTGTWHVVGDPHALPDLDSIEPRVPSTPVVGRLSSNLGRDAYTKAVRRAIEYIHAGDVFQVNLAHRLSGAFEGIPRDAFSRMLALARPWYGALLESSTRTSSSTICSISPELFLDVDPRTRRVTTRPIKGTRPASTPAAALESSDKDTAELVMIVDLMRNDLGRVCEFGSVRVPEPRGVELHGPIDSGVRHGAATIEGTLREDADALDLVAAAFPAGSITGAPKIRAMQIINQLEPSPRGAYCGSIACFSDCGKATMSVAIRTATISGRRLADGATQGSIAYPIGAGIVADSTPDAEWRETLDKARVFLQAIGATLDE